MVSADREKKLMEKGILENTAAITEVSKEFVLANIKHIGKIKEVICESKESGDVTTIKGERNTIRVYGFSFGYYGEGPMGLKWLRDTFDLISERDIFQKAPTRFEYKNLKLYPKDGYSKATIRKHYDYFGRVLICNIVDSIKIPSGLITKSGSLFRVNKNILAVLERNFVVSDVTLDEHGVGYVVTSTELLLTRVK